MNWTSLAFFVATVKCWRIVGRRVSAKKASESPLHASQKIFDLQFSGEIGLWMIWTCG